MNCIDNFEIRMRRAFEKEKTMRDRFDLAVVRIINFIGGRAFYPLLGALLTVLFWLVVKILEGE